MDSRPFVVFSDRPSTPYTPRRCNVRVSSRPSARLPAADWFHPPAHAGAIGGRRGPRRTPDGCRRAGDAAATPAAHAWPRNSRRSRACATDTVALGRGGGKLSHSRPEPLAGPRSPAAPGKPRPRSTKDRRNGVNTFSFSVSVSTKPRKRFSPVIVMPSATTIVDSAKVLPSSTRATTSSRDRSLVELAELGRAGLDERPGHGRPRQADRPGNRPAAAS